MSTLTKSCFTTYEIYVVLVPSLIIPLLHVLLLFSYSLNPTTATRFISIFQLVNSTVCSTFKLLFRVQSQIPVAFLIQLLFCSLCTGSKYARALLIKSFLLHTMFIKRLNPRTFPVSSLYSHLALGVRIIS